MSEGREVARQVAITQRARDAFDPQQVELIRHTVAQDCNPGELSIFLELAARYSLDPFARQIWAVKIDGRMQVMASRDGLLAIANRHSDFRGCQSYEIREHDRFKTTTDEQGHVHVEHRWLDSDGNPTHGGQDGMLRGDIIGAFAYVRREGRVDAQYMAYRAQHDKQRAVWRSNPSAMMIKCAEAMALRKAFSISGLMGEGEMDYDPPDQLTGPSSRMTEPMDFGEDEALAERLREAFHRLQYTRGKVRVLLSQAGTHQQREALLDELEGELLSRNTIEGSAVGEAA